MEVDRSSIVDALARSRVISDRRGMALDRIVLSPGEGFISIASTDGVASSLERVVASGTMTSSFSASSYTIHNAMKRMGDRLELSTDGLSLTVKDGTSSIQLSGVDPGAFPDLPVRAPVPMTECDLSSLGSAVVSVSRMAVPNFAGLHARVRILVEDGVAKVMASNPHSAIRITLETSMPPGVYGIPSAAAHDVFKCGPYSRCGRDGGWLRLHRESLDVAVNATSDEPRFDELFSNGTTSECMRADLIAAIRLTEIAEEEHRGLKVEPTDGGILVTSRGESGTTESFVSTQGSVQGFGSSAKLLLAYLESMASDRVLLGYKSGMITVANASTVCVIAERVL